MPSTPRNGRAPLHAPAQESPWNPAAQRRAELGSTPPLLDAERFNLNGAFLDNLLFRLVSLEEGNIAALEQVSDASATDPIKELTAKVVLATKLVALQQAMHEDKRARTRRRKKRGR